jgi:hypothetical protein
VSREPFFAQKIAKILENSGPKSLENALHLGGRLKNAIFLRKKTFFGTQNHPPPKPGCPAVHARAHACTPAHTPVGGGFAPFWTVFHTKNPPFFELKKRTFLLKNDHF